MTLQHAEILSGSGVLFCQIKFDLVLLITGKVPKVCTAHESRKKKTQKHIFSPFMKQTT